MQFIDASPRLSVWLFKNVERKSVDGATTVSDRYAGSDPYIDLTPLLGEGSSVRTSKSTREPAGGFTITFPDKPHTDWRAFTGFRGAGALESMYGLIEPMDIIEIRMWSGVGVLAADQKYPIVMRGFVSQVSRSQSMSEDGKPQRSVTVSGQDYGKIWQTFQVIYLPNYAEGKGLLTSFALSELFGSVAVNSLPADEFIRRMVEKIINPHIEQMLPATMPADVPKMIQTGEDSISITRGKVNQSFQNAQGSLYEIMSIHGDVGMWNELYTEDREDGVHCVYRAIPAVQVATNEKIMDDAPEPIYCPILESDVQSISVARTDNGVANFWWVDSSKFDMISDLSRKLHSISENEVSTKDYPNTAKKYYGVRAKYAQTQQGEDSIENMNGGVSASQKAVRDGKQINWIDLRRKQMMDMHKDDVVMESGTARVKGLPMREDGITAMKAGDYALFSFGAIAWIAYVYQISHDFVPYQGFFTTLTFDRGTGFAERLTREGGVNSPWLSEQIY
jgi:hypothetical protein